MINHGPTPTTPLDVRWSLRYPGDAKGAVASFMDTYTAPICRAARAGAAALPEDAYFLAAYDRLMGIVKREECGS